MKNEAQRLMQEARGKSELHAVDCVYFSQLFALAVENLKALHNKHAAQVGFNDNAEEEMLIEVSTRDITSVRASWAPSFLHQSD